MIRNRFLLLLLLRYRSFAALPCLDFGDTCQVVSPDDAHDSPSGICFLQSGFAKDSQTLALGQTHNHDSGSSQRVTSLGESSQRVTSLVSRGAASDPKSAEQAIDSVNMEGNEVHHSIFELSFSQLDRATFWFVFACMLAFTIVVDRLDSKAAQLAANKYAEQMFLSRVHAELMMFGCVGLCLFGMSNTTDLNHDQELIVEFVDILCSMGACGLIVMAGVLFAMRKYNVKCWKEQEQFDLKSEFRDAVESQDGAETKQKETKQNTFFNATMMGSKMVDFVSNGLKPIDYQVMAKRFRSLHHLPDDFSYSEYLNQTLTLNACEIMDVKWYTWFSFLIIVLIFFVARLIAEPHFSNLFYIIVFTVTDWVILLDFFVMLWIVDSAVKSLKVDIHKQEEPHADDESLLSQEIDDDGSLLHGGSFRFKFKKRLPLSPIGERWVMAIRFGMQFVALLNSFLLSAYFMHLRHNLNAAGFHWSWRLLLLLPLFINLFVMLPVITSRFTMVEAYFSPDKNAFDVTLQQLTQLELDFAHIRQMWIAKKKPKFPIGEQGVDEEGLDKILSGFGIYVSQARCHRIFEALDVDQGGTVTTEEFMNRLDVSEAAWLAKSTNSASSLWHP